MMRAIHVGAFAASIGSSVPAAAATVDPLCQVLRHFEVATNGTQAHERRWIEFHWGFDADPNTLWSWGCRHSAHASATATCAWLKDHTNQEFTMQLPMGVMRCYGYRFPRYADYDWDGMLGTITLRGHRGRRLILDLNYRDLPHGESAMRLAIEESGVSYEPDEQEPIRPMASDEQQPRRASDPH
jgi:hypothetical protein